MRRRFLAPVLAPFAVVAVLTGGPSPASAVDDVPPTDAATPGAPASALPAPDVEAVQAEVTDLDAEVRRVGAELTERTRALEQDQARLAAVRAEAVRVRRQADDAAAEAAEARIRLGELVGAAYRNPQPSDVALALEAGPGNLGDAVLAAADLDHVRGNQQDVLREATAERYAAQELVSVAERLEADAAEQERALAGLVADLQRRAQEAGERLVVAAERLRAAQAERAAQQARAAFDAAALSGAPPPFVADLTGAACGGASLAGFANGLLPPEALCPLDGTAGLLLRADAAAAFNRMAAAGGMPCAGNSYRSYSEQVALYSIKPDLAAVPGTSNHGWGVAVDFACGAERFGSDAYLWLKANGPVYGWNHPSWAEPDGGRPEPWHWEYTG